MRHPARFVPVQLMDGDLGLVVIAHLHEGTPPRLTGVAVTCNADPVHVSVALEQGPQFPFTRDSQRKCFS
jgi:hypothetical protein